MFVYRAFSANGFLRPNRSWAVPANLGMLGLFVVTPALAAIIPYIGVQQQTFTVSKTGTYSIFAWGASGGSDMFGYRNTGGLGAEIGGQFTLTAGEILTIFVGGVGNNGFFDGGGGGGSFVIGPSGDPFVVAGGGGGAGINSNGQGGLTGASNSQGGSASDVSGGGGGFSTSGGSAGGLLFATGGGAYPGLAGGNATIAGTPGGDGRHA